MKRLVIYIAGPYRGASESEVFANILRARDCAAEVWKAGHIAICPHLNTMLMGGMLPDERWLEGDLEILKRCDGMMLVPGWESSSGSRRETGKAISFGIPIYESLSELPG